MAESPLLESGKRPPPADVTQPSRWTQPANGRQDLALISRCAGIRPAARPRVSCAGEGQHNTRGADVRGSPAVFICPDTRAQSGVVRRGKKERRRRKPGTHNPSVLQESAPPKKTPGLSRSHHAKWMIMTCKIFSNEELCLR